MCHNLNHLRLRADNLLMPKLGHKSWHQEHPDLSLACHQACATKNGCCLSDTSDNLLPPSCPLGPLLEPPWMSPPDIWTQIGSVESVDCPLKYAPPSQDRSSIVSLKISDGHSRSQAGGKERCTLGLSRTLESASGHGHSSHTNNNCVSRECSASCSTSLAHNAALNLKEVILLDNYAHARRKRQHLA